MTDVNNEKISSMKIQKPSLVYNDKKLEKDYNLHFHKILLNSYKAYQISLFAFWLIDLTIEGIKGNLQYQIVTKILKLITFLLSFTLYYKSVKERFLHYFIFYYYFTLLIEIICIYVEKSDNDIKICLQIIVLFSYPLFLANRNFYPIIGGLILFYISLLPA